MFLSPSTRRAAVASSIAFLLALGGCVTEDETLPARPLPPQAVRPAVPPPVPLPPPVASAPAAPHVDLGGRTDVALLLPLTGPGAVIGRDMLDAAELALADVGGDDLALTPKDTGGTADGAAEAARAAVADGARLIVGPRSAPEAEAVAPIARAAGIAVLTFSNQARIAGDGVYVLGFLPEQEAARLARYAGSTGIAEFAVLAPDNAYGRLATDAFRAAILAGGGSVGQIQTYDPGTTDPRPAIEALAASRSEFQAVLLPEPSPPHLRDIASLLPVYRIAQPEIRLLGLDSWDAPNLGSEPALVGGWYVAPPPEARSGFVERFQRTYGRAPGRLATLAYDAVAAAAVLQKTPGAGFTAAALTNPSGFAGVDGIFRLRADGTAERGLAVLEIGRDGPTVLDPAPETFQSAGH